MKADQANIRTVEIHDRAGNVVGSKDVVLYAGLLSQAHEEGLSRVRTSILQIPTEENGRLAIIKAEVETSKGLFEAIGDACPENVESLLAPHLIRVAENRAKARALRDAVNCGVDSLEELDGRDQPRGSFDPGPGASTAGFPRPEPRRSTSTPPRAARSENGAGGAMSEAQRRYLFRLLAGRGYAGVRAEEFLKDRLGVERLVEATRNDASALIDELVKSAPARGSNGAAQSHHQQ